MNVVGAISELPDGEKISELLGGRGQLFLMLEAQSAEEAKKEKERLQKELERITKQYESLLQKLSDEKFTSRAPEQIIVKEKEKLESFRVQMEKLGAQVG